MGLSVHRGPPEAQAWFTDGLVNPCLLRGFCGHSVSVPAVWNGKQMWSLLSGGRTQNRPHSSSQQACESCRIFTDSWAVDNGLAVWPFGKLQTGRLNYRLPSSGPQTMETNRGCRWNHLSHHVGAHGKGPFSDETDHWNQAVDWPALPRPANEPDTQHSHCRRVGTK